MDAKRLLKTAGVQVDWPILLITAEEAISNLLEAIQEYCPNLEIEKLTKQEILKLLNSYEECVVVYHPENRHQERAALIRNFEMLKQYGLNDSDYESLDFC